MSKYKVKRYLNISYDAIGLNRFRRNFRSYHSRFIHSSWLLLEDLDRKVTLNETEYTVFGLYDSYGSEYDIMLKPVKGGAFYFATSKEVAHAMGYSRMRNLVTGVEHTWEIKDKSNHLTALSTPDSDEKTFTANEESDNEDSDNEWSEDSENFVDPLVKALQDDLIDEGDISNI